MMPPPLSHSEAGAPDVEMLESAEDDESTSLNSEDMQGLHVPSSGPQYCVVPELHAYLFEAAEGEDVGTVTQGAPEASPQLAQLASAGEVEPMGDAAVSPAGQIPTRTPPFPAVPSLFFGQAAHNQATPAAILSVSQFDFRADSLATAPTKLQAEAAEAKAAPTVEAKQRLAVPTNPAARKVLPARGTRGSKEARLKVLQELRGSQAPVVEERDRIPGELIDPQLRASQAALEKEDSESELDELEAAVACEEGYELLARESRAGRTRVAASAEAAPAVEAEQLAPASPVAPPAQDSYNESMCSSLCSSFAAFAEAEEDVWQAEAKAERAAAAAAAKEKARAEVRAQLARQEEERKTFAEAWEREQEREQTKRSQVLFPSQVNAVRVLAPGEEVRFAPGHREALAEAETALAMSRAAEEAQRAAESRRAVEAEEQISDEDEEDGPAPDAKQTAAN